jgi:hypothetical protein
VARKHRQSAIPKVPKAPTAPKPPKGPKGLPSMPSLPRMKGLKGLPGLKPFPGSRSAGGSRSAPSGPADPDVVRRLQEALTDRSPITVTYTGKDGDKQHDVFPLALGVTRGGYRLWAYQFAGETEPGWKCFIVAGLRDVSAQPGDWDVPGVDPGPGSCMDEVLQQVT